MKKIHKTIYSLTYTKGLQPNKIIPKKKKEKNRNDNASINIIIHSVKQEIKKF